MKNRATLVSILFVAGPTLANASLSLAVTTENAIAGVAAVVPAANKWVLRAEGSLTSLHDTWLIPGAELGLTLGRDLTSRLSLEATASRRDRNGAAIAPSGSALLAARFATRVSSGGRHALTVAGGPMLVMNNAVHGTLPLLHAELAYVYRNPIGFTFLAGVGQNFALKDSPYVTPPEPDSFLGPSAQEIHAGDRLGQVRLAVGWTL